MPPNRCLSYGEENREDREGYKNPETTRSRHCTRGDTLYKPLGYQEGKEVLMICKPGDLPVMAVIYLRVRGNARRIGFLYKNNLAFWARLFLFATSQVDYKKMGEMCDDGY